MANERPIPTPTGDELETLTQLRLRAARRDRVRGFALQEAYDILGYLQANMGATPILCRSYSGVLTLLLVEGRIAQVSRRITRLRAEEIRDTAVERELWDPRCNARGSHEQIGILRYVII